MQKLSCENVLFSCYNVIVSHLRSKYRKLSCYFVKISLYSIILSLFIFLEWQQCASVFWFILTAFIHAFHFTLFCIESFTMSQVHNIQRVWSDDLRSRAWSFLADHPHELLEIRGRGFIFELILLKFSTTNWGVTNCQPATSLALQCTSCAHRKWQTLLSANAPSLAVPLCSR